MSGGIIRTTFVLILISIAVFNSRQLRGENGTMTLQSGAFEAGGKIPEKYTCEGKDTAPPLAWDSVPENARSLVLIVDDPDAPDPKAPMMTWVHWVLYNIPPETTGLPEGAGRSDLPAGTGEGVNDWHRTGYGGPCPPVGRHRYFFKLYALDRALRFSGNPAKNEVETAMHGHVIERVQLIGTYKK